MALIGAFNRSDTLWRPSAVPIHLTDPTGAYGENPEWERSSRIHLLSVAKEDFLLRSGTKDFLHKHLTSRRPPQDTSGAYVLKSFSPLDYLRLS